MGFDIMMSFDECLLFDESYDYVKKLVECMFWWVEWGLKVYVNLDC